MAVGRSFRLAAALGAALWAGPVEALDPGRALTQYRHQAWSTREGLPQSSVEALAQTPDGYLWVGTQEGLVRHDGLRFAVFDKANTAALRHNRVRALLADRAGTLWVGTEGGGVALLKDGAWSTLPPPTLPSPRIDSFAEDAAGTLWIGTDLGLAALRGGVPVSIGGAPLRSISALLASGRDGLWVAAADGVHLVRGDTVGPVAAGLPARVVNALLEDRDGTLWIATNHGLHVRRAGAEAAIRAPVSLPHEIVTTLLRDRAGTLWIGTDQGGLSRFVNGVSASFGVGQGLSNNQVLELLEDREGSLWIGTQDGGLNQLADAPFVTWSKAEGLPDDVVWSIFGDQAGDIWIGTKSGGLSRFRDGAIQTLSTADGLSSPAVQAIAQDQSGALWIGTRGGGLNRYAHGRFRSWSTREGLPHPSVSAVLAARQGGLWIGTRGGGLARFLDGAFTTWGAADGLPDPTIHALHESRDGALWIATNGGGLVRFENGVFRAFTGRDGLSSDTVNAIHEDQAGTLWVGTFGGGLNRMRHDRFTSYTTSQGLYDDAIFSILEDASGRLWMSCNKGVFRVDKRDLDALDRGDIPRLTPVAYGVADGMKDREGNGANFPPAWRDTRGRLWFSTIEGAAVVDADHLPAVPGPRSVVVEEVVAEGRLQPPGPLRLPPSARSLVFRYAAPTFLAPSRVRFRYQLEGVDPEWIDAGARREAFYSRLPAGEFRFHVAAAGEDGVWHDAPAPLAVTLTPRFTERPAFLIACLLALLGVGLALDRLRTRRQKRREAELESMVEERTRALAEANTRLERLSALDGLTGVPNRRTLDATLDNEWRRACRAGTPVSIVMLDLDSFKAFNDRHGHLAGDDRLRQVALALQGTLGRAGDLLARYGGEEFAALLPGVSAADAAAVAERLRQSVESLVPGEGLEPATLSAGVATRVPRDPAGSAALVAAADAALYRAKREGRNRVAVAAA